MLGLLAAAVYWFILDQRRSDIQQEVKVAEAEVERLKPILEEVEKFKKKKADLERKIEVITNLKNQQTGPVRVMDAISRALPELLWLDRMEVTANQIRISGRAFNVNAVSNFIENLDKVPEFNEPRVGQVRESGEVYEFTITVGYSLTAAEGGRGAGGGRRLRRRGTGGATVAFETGLEGKPWYYGLLVGLLVGAGLFWAANTSSSTR